MRFQKTCVLPAPKGFPDGPVVMNPHPMQETQETWVWSLGQEDPPKKEMATCCSVLAWKLQTEKPGGLQSMGWQRVGHNWVTEHAQAPALEIKVTLTHSNHWPSAVKWWRWQERLREKACGPGLDLGLEFISEHKSWLCCFLDLCPNRIPSPLWAGFPWL